MKNRELTREERMAANEAQIKKNRGREIYGARDAAVNRAHQRMVNSNGYGY